MNSTGNRFGPNKSGPGGEWGGVGERYVYGQLRKDAEAVAEAFLRVTTIQDSPTIRIPEDLRFPSLDASPIEYVETGHLLTLERFDPEDGLLDLVGQVELQGATGMSLSFMLTLRPIEEHVYRLWSAPTFVP